jgi:hypothetical protein
LQHRTIEFAKDANAVVAVMDDDLTKLASTVNAFTSGAATTSNQIALTNLVEQVNRFQEQAIAANDPRRDVWLASIAERVKRSDAMRQTTLLNLGALQRTVDVLERDMRHLHGEVSDMYRHQQANAGSILTTWVHVQHILGQMAHGWRDQAGLPPMEDLPVKCVSPIPDVDPEEFRLELASASTALHEDNVYGAPNRQPDPEVYSLSSRTPVATPTLADVGGSGAPADDTLPSLQTFSKFLLSELEAYIESHDLRDPNGTPLNISVPSPSVCTGDWRLQAPAPAPVPEAMKRTDVMVPKLNLSFLSPAPAPAPPKEPELVTRSPAEFLHTSSFLFSATPPWPMQTMPDEQAPAVVGAAPPPEPQPELRPAMSPHESEAVAVEQEVRRQAAKIAVTNRRGKGAVAKPPTELVSQVEVEGDSSTTMDIDPMSAQKGPSPEPAAEQPLAAEPPAVERPQAKQQLTKVATKNLAKSQPEPVQMSEDPGIPDPRRGTRERVSKHENLSESSLASARSTSVGSNAIKKVAMFHPLYYSNDVQTAIDCYDADLDDDLDWSGTHADCPSSPTRAGEGGGPSMGRVTFRNRSGTTCSCYDYSSRSRGIHRGGQQEA